MSLDVAQLSGREWLPVAITILTCSYKTGIRSTSNYTHIIATLTALHSGPSEAYCVDLTTGKTSVLPGDTDNVEWTKKPTSNGGRCKLQGVLKITPPCWAKSVSFHMAFEESNMWSFNFGDSPTNNGWGKTVLCS